MSDPSATLAGAPGDPDAWLGFGTWETMPVTAAEVAAVDLRGPLRGVTAIDLGKLQRAMRCEVRPIEHAPGAFFVWDPAGRNAREGKSEGQYVHLDDPHMDRCYCEDFLQPGGARDGRAGEDAGVPCKHILAAVLAHPKHAPQLDPFLALARQNSAVAAALQKPVTE